VRLQKITWVLSLTVLSALASSQLLAQEDVIKKRKAFMEDNYDGLKAIKKAVQEKDYATTEVKAKEIMGNMDKLLAHFPKGSTSEKSRAKEEIWEKWDEFSKIPLKVKDVAGALAKAAAAKDEAEVQVRFKALGPESPFRSGACYECHDAYLKPRKPAGK
jgi:cytochrome c556